MFVGSINQDVRALVQKLCSTGALDGRDVYVACSGNFAFESIISSFARPARLHSNDVSLYSCAFGWYLTDRYVPLVFSPEIAFAQPFAVDPLSNLAVVAVLLDMLEFFERKNAHERRMWGEYLRQFPDLVEACKSRIKQLPVRIDSFFAGDALQFITDAPDDGVFFAAPPTYTRGYERLYRRLESLVSWPKPDYAIINNAYRRKMLAILSARSYLYVTDQLLPGLSPALVSQRSRKRVVYVYTNLISRAYLARDQLPSFFPFRVAESDFVPLEDDEIAFVEVPPRQVLAMKQAFLSRRIQPVVGQLALAVLIRGQVVGFLEFSRSYRSPSQVYLLSDFAVVRTPRMSKLIAMLATSAEVRRIVERKFGWRVSSLLTSAFTDKPVSMKYRGVFRLENRRRVGDDAYVLAYVADYTSASCQEIYRAWLTKYAKHLTA